MGDWWNLIIFSIVILAIAKPMGLLIDGVLDGKAPRFLRWLSPLERGIYKAGGIDPSKEMGWKSYGGALMVFSVLSIAFLFLLMRIQHGLPGNPDDIANVEPKLALNTAVSFVTNTNWQNYLGETTMTQTTQMMGLAVQNFVSAAVGMAVAIAAIRGFTRRSASSIGNFWADITRSIVYILLPICFVIALVFVWRGMPQNFHEAVSITTLTGQEQTIPQGPVASQEVIKMFGTNGGGYFNANSAHPYENPTPFTNFIQMVLIFAIPAGFTYTFGRKAGNTKQGWAIFAAMGVLFLVGVAITTVAERDGNPILTDQGGASQAQTVNGADAPGGNMEGKELRFGISTSALFAVITTAASCGAVIAMHDSFTPIGGLIPLVNIGLGEVIFGGVGAGMYGMIIIAVTAIFIAGLMVGRTPEYLGKKIEPFEMKMAMLSLVAMPIAILGLAGPALVSAKPLASIWNAGPHGLSEVLYAFTSAAGNNGSAFAGLSGNTTFYNLALATGMFVGRFLPILAVLALAGSLAKKRRLESSVGTFPTTGPLWVGLLIGVILIVGALTYLPAYSLGPIIEQIHMRAGVTF
ncbi:potassium-transporting ATPase subunit KdpA [soil metagenome]